MNIVETPEQIKQHYSACMDSVNLIETLKSNVSPTEEDIRRLNSNVEHLKLMLTRTYWTTEDLKPLKNAVK